MFLFFLCFVIFSCGGESIIFLFPGACKPTPLSCRQSAGLIGQILPQVWLGCSQNEIEFAGYSPPCLPPCIWSVVDWGGGWIAVRIFLVHFAFNPSGPPDPTSMIIMKLSGTKWFVFAYLPFLYDSFLGKIVDGGSIVKLSNLFLHLELFQMVPHPASPHSRW